MKIISIDSSGLVASVAVIEDDKLIAEYNTQYQKTHSQTLLPMLDEIKKMTELDLSTVDAIAISKGPGSFTGLRIGSATAKGLAYALDVPIVEVSTLEGMAACLYGTDAIVCPLMDARRMEVYTAVYKYTLNNGEYTLNTLMNDSALPIEELVERLNELNVDNKPIVFLGDGVKVARPIIEEKLRAEYVWAPEHMNAQRAAAVGYIAMQKLKMGETVSCYEHEIEYLRVSQAERTKNEGIKTKGSTY